MKSAGDYVGCLDINLDNYMIDVIFVISKLLDYRFAIRMSKWTKELNKTILLIPGKSIPRGRLIRCLRNH